jgi:hypothetical protein
MCKLGFSLFLKVLFKCKLVCGFLLLCGGFRMLQHTSNTKDTTKALCRRVWGGGGLFGVR